MTCPRRGCAQPMRLDTEFERTAMAYMIPRRRWVDAVGHSYFEPVDRPQIVLAVDPERAAPGARPCAWCRKPMREPTARQRYHARCAGPAGAAHRRLRLAVLAPKACRSCAGWFAPASASQLDCDGCRAAYAPCALCRKRHPADGRHSGDRWIRRHPLGATIPGTKGARR